MLFPASLSAKEMGNELWICNCLNTLSLELRRTLVFYWGFSFFFSFEFWLCSVIWKIASEKRNRSLEWNKNHSRYTKQLPLSTTRTDVLVSQVVFPQRSSEHGVKMKGRLKNVQSSRIYCEETVHWNETKFTAVRSVFNFLLKVLLDRFNFLLKVSLKIVIQKPENPIKQALTRYDYKNTSSM